jgi:hypothetical protein
VIGLSAAILAVRDQAQALVRDLVAVDKPVLFIDLPNGEMCCWCNCPADAPDTDACGGCDAPADAVLRVCRKHEPDESWAVCQAHRDDALRLLRLFIAAAAPG